MEIDHRAQTTQVLRRIQQVREQEAHSLLGLIQEEWKDASIYLQLSRLIGGQPGQQLRQMALQEHSHGACLRGIYTLMTGTRPETPIVPVQITGIDATLRSCYGREMRCLAQYEQRAGDREYGIVFEKLALQEQEHCRTLLEIIGTR